MQPSALLQPLVRPLVRPLADDYGLPFIAPLVGAPLELSTQDGVLFQTADGVYFGVSE